MKNNGFFTGDTTLLSVMGTSSGRKLIWDFLDISGVFRMTYVSGHLDDTAFNEGKRYLGTLLFAQIQESCPELYQQMVFENQPKKSLNKEEKDYGRNQSESDPESDSTFRTYTAEPAEPNGTGEPDF